ncbi:MAG: hypothetical protein AAF613_05430 [Pseudomonadota bacterium]
MPLSDQVDYKLNTNANPVNVSLMQTSYPVAGPPPRAVGGGDGSAPGAAIEDESWLVTLAFLLGLVLFGIVTGYLMRGGNANSAQMAVAMPSPLASISVEDARLATSTDAPETMSFGSDAPDELLSFEVSDDGDSFIGLIQTHNPRANGADRLSFIRVAYGGAVEETELVVGESLAGGAISAGFDSAPVAAVIRAEDVQVQAINPSGRFKWRRNFPILPGHAASVGIATIPGGSVTIGPGESRDRIGLIHLGSDGELMWQRSFASHSVHPDAHIQASPDGAIFVTLRNIPEDAAASSHSIMRIEADGQMAWKRPLDIGISSVITGFDVSEDGGLFILTSGGVPSLSKYDADGGLAWVSPVPNVSQQDTLYLLPGRHGEAVVASPYSLLGQRLYVSLQKWDSAGLIIADKELTLPADSSLDVLTYTPAGDYVLAGSVLPHRYDDADIYFTRASPAVDSWNKRSAATDSMVLSLATTAGEAVTVAASTVPTEPVESVAALQDAPKLPRTDVIEAIESEEQNIPEQTVLAPAALALPVETNTAAALSAFVDTGTVQRGQCRFTCLEQRGGGTFPMWASVEAPVSGFDRGLSDIHAQVCSAARGRIYSEVAPDCRILE